MWFSSLWKSCFSIVLVCFLSLTSGIDRSFAAVSFFGSVNPDPPGDGDVESTLVIGLLGDDDPDPRGFVFIDGGTQIEYDALTLGDDDGTFGSLTISGSLTPGGQSRLTLEESGTTTIPTAQIGHEGVGHLVVEGGASLFFENSSADLSLGVETSGVGTMTVRGNFSLVVVPDSFFVGDDGIGRLEILAGGIVHASDTSNTALIGASATGSGTVLVDGLGSIWKLGDNLTVGASGMGTLIISNQGLVDVDQPAALTTIGQRGRLELDGGTFSGDVIMLEGTLTGSGLVRGDVTAVTNSRVEVPAGALLQFVDSVNNSGAIHVQAGELSFLAGLSNLANISSPSGAPGRIVLDHGRLNLSQELSNNGVIVSASGANHFHGEITNGSSGAIAVAGQSVATFYDDVTIGDGTLDVQAGANALFLSDLTFITGGTATLEISNSAIGSAQLFVGGTASLAGELQVDLSGGQMPAPGDSYTLLSATEGISGMFDSVTLPTLAANLEWNLLYGQNDLLLEVLSVLPGDFDFDGDVDGHDFLVWQRDLSVGNLNDWQANYGMRAGEFISPGSVPVPEPASGWMFVWLVASGWWCGRNTLRSA